MPTKAYRFGVTGMHCSSCAQLITNRLKKIPDISDVSASYATEQLSFKTGKLNLSKLQREMSEIGYGLITEPESKSDSDVKHQPNSTAGETKMMDHMNHDMGTEAGWESLLPAAGFTFVIMMYEILSQRLGLPTLPWPMIWLKFFWWLIASYALLGPGKQFVTAVGRFFKIGVANMDTLVGFGTLTAYLYSTLGLFFPLKLAEFGLPPDSYFDVTIVVIAFVLLGKHLEGLAKAKTGEALRALTKLQAKNALVIRNGTEEMTDIEAVQIGELIKVKAGEKIPLDGMIIEGQSSVDESLLTGESLPILKQVGEAVLGGSLNQEGVLIIKTTKTGQSGFLHQVVELVLSAQASKAPIERLADQISAWFVPAVLILAVASFGGWLFLGTASLAVNLSLAIHSLVGVLVIACPCALGLATPTAMIVAMGKAAGKGILIKDAATIERLSKVTAVVTDKTGTLTVGKPKLQSIIVANKKYTIDKVLELAAGLESGSTHPLSHAITTELAAKKLAKLEFKAVKHQVGVGVVGEFKAQKYWIGGRGMLGLQKVKQLAENSVKPGEMLLYLGQGKDLLASFVLADELKTNAAIAVRELKSLGLEVSLLSGDRQTTADLMASLVGIEKVQAEANPESKLVFVKQLQSEGKIVAMVGDGVNDAPALAQADVGIAMSTGSDSALATAGLTLLHGDLLKLAQSIKLARKTMTVVRQNLFWAFIYNIIGIPLAAGWLYPVFGWLLNPAFAGLAMAMSSVSVVSNSLRLKWVKI